MPALNPVPKVVAAGSEKQRRESNKSRATNSQMKCRQTAQDKGLLLKMVFLLFYLRVLPKLCYLLCRVSVAKATSPKNAMLNEEPRYPNAFDCPSNFQMRHKTKLLVV